MVTTGMVGRVNTVLGVADASQLGITMPHEHVLVWTRSWFMDSRRASMKGAADHLVSLKNLERVRRNPWSYRDNLALAPLMLDMGTSQRDLDTITQDNPQRLLGWSAPME